MSTSSAGTQVNFGSQGPPPEHAESEAPTPAQRPKAGASVRRARGVELDELGVAEAEAVVPASAARPDREQPQLAATSSVAAEAQQGDGPAAASASGSAVGETNVASRAVSVVVGPHGAAAACELGVVVVGAQGAAAASAIGVASAGPHGAAAAGNGANSSTVAYDAREGTVVVPAALDSAPAESVELRLARLEQDNQELTKLLNGHAARRRQH